MPDQYVGAFKIRFSTAEEAQTAAPKIVLAGQIQATAVGRVVNIDVATGGNSRAGRKGILDQRLQAQGITGHQYISQGD